MATGTSLATEWLQIPIIGSSTQTPSCPSAIFNTPSAANVTAHLLVQTPITLSPTAQNAAPPMTVTCIYPIVYGSNLGNTNSTSDAITSIASTAPTTNQSTASLIAPSTISTGSKTDPTSSTVPNNSFNHAIGRPSSAEIIGIALGSFGAGLSLAGFVWGLFFFLRRKRRSKPDNHPILPDKATSETPVSFPRPLEGKTTHSSVLAAGRSPGLTLHSYLLDGPGDSEVGSEFHDLEFLLKSHVEDCYHEKPVSYGLASIKQSLEGLGLDEWTQEQIAKSSLDPRQRHAAIRSFMSRVIFSALDIQSISGHSLLPPEVVAFVKALPPTVKSQSPGSPTTQVLDMWRRCSAFLLHEDRQERTLLPPPQGSQWQVKELQRALDKFLVHFLDEHTQVRQNQGEDLNAVIQEFVKFGYAVFSHSCSWRYSFEAEHTCWSKGIVIMPGLERLTRRNGEVLEKPEVVVPPLFENTR